MKKIISLTLGLFIATTMLAQLPNNVTVKDLDGKNVSVADISNNGKPIIISFWATWCKPCMEELNTIADEYPDWVDETGVELIAVSIDDARSTGKVEPLVNSKGWDYTILLDPNGDFKRGLNVNNVPHTFLLDGKGNIVWDHNNYAAGDEEELYEELLKVAK
ncbi:TlpA family protein disulfide reductase [Parvicella tangerina]|uniref:Thiol-disulfide oxidoreductase ResA n=1 Tax=Parvicella tangerina TaxID=2829795 RepID=A0A916NF13_9FLAO|nr:TlpA disulfide reductase family protein [Parvicella tangerina]CAG5077443.1 Thiol-disulfide oxidoreductase ResA [Parvicella tangerina]